MKLNTIGKFIFLGVFLIVLQTFASAGLRVMPSTVDVKFGKKPIAETLMLKNTGGESLMIKAYVMGLAKNKKGDWVFTDPVTKNYNLNKYVTISRSSFVLNADQESKVIVNVKKPKYYSGKFQCVVFFENYPLEKTEVDTSAQMQTLVEIHGRLGVIFKEK
ncbi:hypothetical protein A3J90_08560 [candidate division WOR-1 bacterium RIFOXYC2_FULL_37_10]|uniref:Uncharacterized protein n=1 Tax=candidate division WOR-1 bacterium RIFOXYB2_FULL_37_13 TaxID=1802579 RepID=A0A1F4SMA2_UNCSA|nr:MAG: hypothetical protein A2246_01625 [candidate division WOR-1 bacterium RIFOXYA2_FULL_37_7]OGC21594.1 MAG: hypothetical protein A2310_02210 [candidate division WOR-1 bacterium RIFOXYB2_FULL_37_13]OGC33028.1 MAG: hypothetical protein A3J90_08560 [candidate division WOR-1 bacterium RIFOXYC2_FULL_37_10]